MIKHRRLPPTARPKLGAIPDRARSLPGLSALWLFGSYVRGEQTPLSDLDFAYLRTSGSTQPSIFYGAREVKGDMVVSDVQLYLDLTGYKGRGEEAATFILEQRLRPRW